jgi:septal ring factor EnvC (AmiA/AmiB activator)
MKTIKKYWKIIVGAIVALFGVIFLISRKITANKLDKTDEEIDKNNSKIDKLAGKLERIKKEEAEVKADIKEQKEDLTETKKNKDDIIVPKRTTIGAKENIIKKTRK